MQTVYRSLLVLAFGLAACGAPGAAQDPQAAAPTQRVDSPAPSQPATAAGAPTESAPPVEAATGAPTAPPAPVKDEFTPTDPASVNLAAGKPQLVEFFAFW